MASAMRGPVVAGTAAVALLVGGWLAMPREAVVQRSATVGAGPDAVYARVVDVEAMQAWSPWAAADPDLEVALGAVRSGVGASFTWRGEAGEGSWTITEVEPGKRVTSRLEMGNGATATSTLDLAPEGAGTKVTWTLVAADPGLTSGLFALNADSLLGPSLRDGLARLGGEGSK